MASTKDVDRERRLLLASDAFRKHQFPSIRAAAQAHNVGHSTLSRRLKGQQPRSEARPNSMKLTKLEEEVMVSRILELSSEGFPQGLDSVEEMANSILLDREANPVGINWASNFVARRPELQLSRKGKKKPITQPQGESRAPMTSTEFYQQAQVLEECFKSLNNDSPGPALQAFIHYNKAAIRVRAENDILREEIASLREINGAKKSRTARIRQTLQGKGHMSVEEARDSIEHGEVDVQLASERRVAKGSSRACSSCGKTGHNSRTCKI